MDDGIGSDGEGESGGSDKGRETERKRVLMVSVLEVVLARSLSLQFLPCRHRQASACRIPGPLYACLPARGVMRGLGG